MIILKKSDPGKEVGWLSQVLDNVLRLDPLIGPAYTGVCMAKGAVKVFDKCSIDNEDKQKELAKKWGSYDHYLEECQFFMDMNCCDPEGLKTPSFSVVLDFMKTAYK